MSKRNNRRNLEVKFTFKCSIGNTIVEGIPLGSVGEWVGRMGGDDLTIEELLYFGHHIDEKGTEWSMVTKSKKGNKY